MNKGIQPIKELKTLQPFKDKEEAHVLADDILCNLLIELGYVLVVDEYRKITRWCG